MPATFSIPTQDVIPGQLITAVLWNDEYQNIYDNFTPSGVDDYSATDGEMQTQTAPFPGSVISRPTSLAGEMERLRYALAGILGETYWYNAPDKTIVQLDTFDLGHRHTGTTDGLQIQAGGLATDAVETAKIKDANVTAAKLAADAVETAKIKDGAVTNAKVTDVAFGKITGTVTPSDNTVTNAKLGAGAVTDTKVTDVATTKLTGTILAAQLASDAVETAKIKDANVTEGKLATAVVNKLGQTIGMVAVTTSDVSYTGQGRLLGIVTNATGNYVTVVIDGVTVASAVLLSSNQALIWGATGLTGGTGTLGSLGIFFRTSLVITKTGGGTLSVAYERAA